MKTKTIKIKKECGECKNRFWSWNELTSSQQWHCSLLIGTDEYRANAKAYGYSWMQVLCPFNKYDQIIFEVEKA